MKLKNLQKIQELIETYQKLIKLQEKLSALKPSDITSLNADHTTIETIDLDVLTVDNLGKLQGYILSLVNEDIKNIEKEIDEL